MSAFDISKEIKKKNIKIIEVINIFIEHIKNMNQKVNFLAYNCFEEAINIAKKYDKRLEEKFIQKKIKDLPLLFGVPIMLKESISLKNKQKPRAVLCSTYAQPRPSLANIRRVLMIMADDGHKPPRTYGTVPYVHTQKQHTRTYGRTDGRTHK